MLSGFVGYSKINYLMLMMVDPDVHFHVIPRYQGERRFEGIAFPDAGWPAAPDLAAAVSPEPEVLAALVQALRRNLPDIHPCPCVGRACRGAWSTGTFSSSCRCRWRC